MSRLINLLEAHVGRCVLYNGAPIVYCVMCSPVELGGKLESVEWPCPPLCEAGLRKLSFADPAPSLCPNTSFYGRPCTLEPHGWRQSCEFGPDPDPDENLQYDLERGSTLRDLLEAFSAGGPIAINAAMRWVEYRLHRDARDAEQHIGGIIAQVRAGAVTAAQNEQQIVLDYLEQQPVTSITPAAAGEDELGLTRLALRDANRALYAVGIGPFLPGHGQLPLLRAERLDAEILDYRTVDGR